MSQFAGERGFSLQSPANRALAREAKTMKGLILAPRLNSVGSRSPHDAESEFQPGALTFQRAHRLATPPVIFTNTQPYTPRGHTLAAPFGLVLQLMEDEPGPWDFFAYFGHGLSDSLLSANIGTAHLPRFARILSAKGVPGMRVIFYACGTGAPGGFAATVSQLLGTRATVFGHLTEGPSYSNPNWVRYPGGNPIVPRRDPLRAKWETALRSTELWAHFPWMTDGEIRAALITGCGSVKVIPRRAAA
jgi:hypothetical protein